MTLTIEYEPDCDADGFRHPGNHHAEHHGDYSPGSSLRPSSSSKSGRPLSKPHPFAKRPIIAPDSKPNSFTFEHEPDVDGDGYRHHHENLSSPALRALQDVVVPLDPRAGRIVITPSPSLKPNFSPYRHIDDIPNRSVEDFQDPEELHSHADMIYGINEKSAKDSSGPDWMEVEQYGLIDEASHGEVERKVSERPVDTRLHIDPSGKLMAPVGGIAGDRRSVGPTRTMEEEEMKGISGAYTVDGEGSAGLPFDGNSGEGKKEGDIEISNESSAVPIDMTASTETIRASQPNLSSSLKQPSQPPAAIPEAVDDIKLPEKSLSQDGTAMETTNAKDERPEWLRAAEMLANNEHQKLIESKLVTEDRASKETLDFASAARANLIRDMKSERGASYPNLAELVTLPSPDIDRQGVSKLPEKDLWGANPPTGSKERSEKFALEDETNTVKSKPNVEPATAAKFLGLTAGAAAGASLPAAALMNSDRDLKSGSTGETKIDQTVPKQENRPVMPKSRPTVKTEGFSPIAPVAPASEPKQFINSSFSLEKIVRPNIWKLAPYRCARDDYNGPGFVFLDANENAYGASLGSDYVDRQALNRYPDPNQVKVKELICDLRGGGVKPENLFLGVGSDEAIDCVMRVFCVPGKDKILITPPTYGMYSVSASINDVAVVKVPLDPENQFQPRMSEIMDKLQHDETIKLLFLCSPGNPTSKLIDQKHIRQVLESGWSGVVVIDEAYIDFSVEGSSVTSWVNSYPNLLVMQTMSKAFGLAAIRLGAAFTSPEIAKIMNSLKAPYNISTPTSDLAIKALSKDGLKTMRSHVSRLNAARTTLAKSLLEMKNVKQIIGGTEGNFIMAQIQSKDGLVSNDLAYKVYENMAQARGVVVRFRGHEHGCEGCLRITVGTEDENEKLLEMLQKSFASAQGEVEPIIPARPKKAETPSIPNRPQKEIPVIPPRPGSSTSRDGPVIPARPVKRDSMPRDEGTKPVVAPRPSKFAAKSAFVAALEAKLKIGPSAPKKKEEPVEEKVPEVEAAPVPLVDARKGRARGPAKRKPVAEEPVDETPSTRDSSVQTGTIEISTPAGDMTILEGAGTDSVPINTDEAGTDFKGQTIVIPKDNKLQPAGSLVPPTVTTEEAAGGEIRSLEKNNMTPVEHTPLESELQVVDE